VLDVIEDERLLARVTELGGYLKQGLQGLASRHRSIGEIRGMGLMIGVDLGSLAKETVSRLLNRGIIANAAHNTVLRLLPPYVISQAEIDEFLRVLDVVLTEIETEPTPNTGAGV